MLRPLVLQQILDTIVTHQPSSASSSPAGSSSDATPHTALIVLKETGTLYAASSRYVSPSSPSPAPPSGSNSPSGSSAQEAPPHPVFRGLLCSSSSSSYSLSGEGGAQCSSLEERNRAIGVLSCLAWRERCARRSVEDEERTGCLSVRSSQYGLLHIRPLLPPPRSQRQQRSLSSHSYSQSPSPNRTLPADAGSTGPGPSPSSFAAAEHGAEGEGEEAVFLLVLNAALPEAAPSASAQEQEQPPGEGTSEGMAGSGGAGGEQASSTSLPALQARLQGLAQLVATSLAPALRILER